MQPHSYPLGDIAAYLEVELRGNADAIISGLATLSSAGAGDLAFLSNPKFENQLATCQAEAVILHPNHASQFASNCLIADDPYLAYAKISHWFDPAQRSSDYIDSRAVIHPTANVANNVFIGANAVIDADVHIGQGCQIGANSTIGAGSIIGNHCDIKPNVAIYHGVRLGDKVTVHSGAAVSYTHLTLPTTPYV